MHGRSGKRFGGTRPWAHMSETLDAKLTKKTCTSNGLSDGELQTLWHLMAKFESPCTSASTSTSFSNLASSGISYSAFNTSRTIYDDSWIIDSGASDHMTSAQKNFFTYSPFPIINFFISYYRERFCKMHSFHYSSFCLTYSSFFIQSSIC